MVALAVALGNSVDAHDDRALSDPPRASLQQVSFRCATSELREKLLSLASRAGIDGARVYQVDISRRTTRLNAYVAGLGPTKRIVIWDTTLSRLSDDEILAIMGHEMGHYVLGHVWIDFAAGVAGAFALLWILFEIVSVGNPAIRFARRYTRPDRYCRSSPLLPDSASAAVSADARSERPVKMAEHQADRYGLELTT